MDIVAEILWVIVMQLYQLYCRFLFREKRLFPGNPSKQAKQVFLVKLVMNLNISHTNQGPAECEM